MTWSWNRLVLGVALPACPFLLSLPRIMLKKLDFNVRVPKGTVVKDFFDSSEFFKVHQNLDFVGNVVTLSYRQGRPATARRSYRRFFLHLQQNNRKK